MPAVSVTKIQHDSRKRHGHTWKLPLRSRQDEADAPSAGDVVSATWHGGEWAEAVERRGGGRGARRSDNSLVGLPAELMSHDCDGSNTDEVRNRVSKDTTIMNMMAALILAVTGITVIVIIITAAFSGADQAAVKGSTAAAAPVPSPTRLRQHPTRAPGVLRSQVAIRPQYLPALAQSRLLRLRLTRLSIATLRQRPVR